jgi:hypothetical protein
MLNEEWTKKSKEQEIIHKFFEISFIEEQILHPKYQLLKKKNYTQFFFLSKCVFQSSTNKPAKQTKKKVQFSSCV